MTVITAYLLGLATLPVGVAAVWFLYRLFRREAWLCPRTAWRGRRTPRRSRTRHSICRPSSPGRPFSFMGGRHAIAHGGGSTRSTTSGRRIRPRASNRNV